MLQFKQGIALVAVGSMAFIAGRVLPAGGGAAAAQPTKDSKGAQPTKEKAPGHEQPGDQMMMPKPGPEHKVMEAFIGEFTGGGKFWMMPGSEPEEFKGKVSRKWDMDGLFVVENMTGDAVAGQPAYKATSFMGYNTFDHRYETAWIENMSTYIGTMNGTYDAAKKTFTFTGDIINPATQKKTKQRVVINIADPDKEVMTCYCNDESGQEFKSMDATFTRTSK